MVASGVLLAFVSLLAWACSDILKKLALRKTSWWKLLVFAQLSGGGVMLIISLFTTDFLTLFTKGGWILLILGGINMAAFFTMYKSISRKGLALTAPIINSWALVSIPLSLLFYRETLGSRQWMAIILIVVGISVVTAQKRKIALDKSYILPLLSMLLWGLFFFLLKIPNAFFHAFLITASVKLLSLVWSIPFIIRNKISLGGTAGSPLLVAIGLLDALGFVSINYALQRTPVSLVSPIITAVPVVVVLLGIFLFKETISFRQGVGIVLTLGGLFILVA